MFQHSICCLEWVLDYFYVVAFLTEYKYGLSLWKWLSCGIFHIFLGMSFLSIKPYKKNWMNRVDGLLSLLLFVGVTLVMLPSPANKL